MAKFKVGDRVRVVEVNNSSGAWLTDRVGKTGVVEEEDSTPWVGFDDGTRDWGSEDFLELATETPAQDITLSLNYITIGGKRFRLVPEE